MDSRRAAIYGWLLLTPAIVMLTAFTHYPAVITLWHSFFSTPRGKREAKFIGLENYRTLLDDDIFWQVLLNNFWYAVGTIPLSVGLAIVMALWVNGKLAGRGFLRMSYFTPTVLPLIAVANIWMFFYTPGFGLIDQISGLFGFASHNWLGDPDTVLNAIIAVAIWKEAGFFMIFYLAALQSIPPSLAEAAALEGASRWTFFRRVTFPLLMPDHALRADQRGDQRLPAGRSHLPHDRGGAGQRQLAVAVLHLRERLQVLGHQLCRHLDRGAAGHPGRGLHRSVPLSSIARCTTSERALSQ